MKLNEILNVLVGIAFLAGAAYIFSAGRAVGRYGLTSLTRESHPVLFWIEVCAFAGAGLLLISYRVAKTAGLAARYTGSIEVITERVNNWRLFGGGKRIRKE